MITPEQRSEFCVAELTNLRTLPGNIELSQVLDSAERTRCARIRSASRQRQFLAGHWLVRQLACERLGGSLTDWLWRSTTGGLPSLQRANQAICVSVSHSGEWLACAISSAPVGIDVEVASRERDWQSLAAYAFTPDVHAEWTDLPEAERKLKFLNWWCLHEAKGKRDGRGIEFHTSRQPRLLPSTAAAFDAISWPLTDGFLALASPAEAMMRGCDARRSWWRFEETSKPKSSHGRA